MPGPAGGSGGGGFGGGSRGGGGGYRGGYGGGPHHHHHHHYGGFFFFPWRRPYYGYGGGFFGGFFGLFLLPILILVLAGSFLVTSIVGLIGAIINGGVVQYSDRKFDDYMNASYSEVFGAYSETYEDNILIVLTTTEDADGYYITAWAGNNITSGIDRMFGEDTEFGEAVENNIRQDDYFYSLDKNLAGVVSDMANEIKKSGYKSFINENTAEHAPSLLINRDEDISFSGAADAAIKSFTEETGIPLVIIVEDEEEVFGKSFPVGLVISGVISIGLVTFAVIWIVKSAKAKKRAAKEEENRRNGTDYNDPRYWN